MATINTVNRKIQVKETADEVIVKQSFSVANDAWIVLTEIICGEKMNGESVRNERKTHINTKFIVEVYD